MLSTRCHKYITLPLPNIDIVGLPSINIHIQIPHEESFHISTNTPTLISVTVENNEPGQQLSSAHYGHNARSVSMKAVDSVLFCIHLLLHFIVVIVTLDCFKCPLSQHNDTRLELFCSKGKTCYV